MKEYQKQYRESKTDEQKQNMKEYQKIKNKKNMTDEQKQKLKDYQKEHYAKKVR